MSSDVFLLHGFNVRDGGKSTVGRLVEFLPNSRVFSYGWLGLIGVYLLNGFIARRLVRVLTAGCTVVAHSNGADIIHRALQLDECLFVDRVVLIRPALDCDAVFGGRVGRVDVFHHEDDVPVGFAKYLPCSSWGNMGEVGYEGSEQHVVNHDSELLFGDASHSAFAGGAFEPFVLFLCKLLGVNDARA